MPQAINSTRLLWSASNDPADYLQRIRAIHPFGPK